MRILHVIDSLGIGGAEKLITEVVPIQVTRNHIVNVMLLSGEKTFLYETLHRQKCCQIFELGKSFYNPLYIFKIIPFLKKYDVIHVHLFPAQYFVVLAKILGLSDTKLVFTEHNTSNKRMDNVGFLWIEKFIYFFYQKIICITPEVKEVLKTKLKLSNRKLVVIDNGINIALIDLEKAAKRTDFNFEIDDKILIMVAGFREQKDQDTVIRALKLFDNSYKLILVGDGDRRQALEVLVEELDLQDRVHFLGIRSDVYSLIKMSNLAILSSHWEGFGLVAVEAMACGVPLIASNVDGLAQVVEGGGVLFEKGNELDLQSKILKLTSDPILYSSTVKSGLNRAKQYDINIMVDKTIELYKSL